jgi:hypothetical protein
MIVCNFCVISIIDGFVKSQKTPSPLMGEGRGEGENNAISSSYIPLPFIPSHQGRGNSTFYEFIIIDELVKSQNLVTPAQAGVYKCLIRLDSANA